MNLIPFRAALPLLAIIAIISACAEVASPPELLAGTNSQTWRLTGRSLDSVPDLLNLCEKTFDVVFNTDESWSWSFTGEECVPEAMEGSWAFNTTQTVLTLSPTGGTAIEWTILTLDESTPSVRYDDGGVSVEDSYTAQ